MASINRVYAARLARMLVLGPMGESLGRVRDVVVSISIVRQQPRVLGLVVEMTFAPKDIRADSAGRCDRARRGDP